MLHSKPRLPSTRKKKLTRKSLWAIKFSVSMFLRTLTESIWQRSHQRLLRYLHIFLAVTFGATIVADLGACQPFTHYWQVVPDPGPQCRQGSTYLFTMGILNISTNFALILFPVPMILKSRLPLKMYPSFLPPKYKKLTRKKTSIHHRPTCSPSPFDRIHSLRNSNSYKPPLRTTYSLPARFF
jgi:hypothetical protein